MIWFKEWGIWNDPDEEAWMKLLEKFRTAADEHRTLRQAPGHLFQESEFVEAKACWSLPVIFGWDAFLFPESSDYFAFNSHDEVLSIVSRNLATHEALLNQFGDWEIEKGAPGIFADFKVIKPLRKLTLLRRVSRLARLPRAA